MIDGWFGCGNLIHSAAMVVGMYMTRDVEVISPEETVGEAVRKMSERQIRRLVVMERGSIVGMVSRRDLVNAFPDHVNPFSPAGAASGESGLPVRRIMTHPVFAIEHDKPIEQAAQLMIEYDIGSLPVTSGGKLSGIITESDIFRALTEVLSERGDSVRITFDLTEGEDAVSFLVETARKNGLSLRTFIAFHDGDRRMGVASVHGKRVDALIAELWKSGHRVESILRSGDES